MDLYPVFCRNMAGLTPGSSLVVAFSGGLDSTVLLALAARLAQEQGLAIKAVHIAHGLQQAAAAWPAHCAQVAQSLGVRCETVAVQVALGPRVSLEAAAREARYQALAQAMQPGDILLTGHHLDDQAETLLLALKRGAGVAGLAAMPMHKPFGQEPCGKQQWRPLLNCSRQALEAYGRAHKLSWVEDPSNADDAFDRNFLRHCVLPGLLAQWPSFNTTLARSAELCAEQMQLAQEVAESDLPGLLNAQSGLLIGGLQALSPARRHNVLRHWLQQQGIHPSRSQLQAIWQEVALARHDALPDVRLGQRHVQRYQGTLYVPATLGSSTPLATLSAEHWQDAGVGQLRLSRVSQAADLVADLAWDQLRLAFNVSGLRAQPYGRAGSRPLKKLWQEYAIAPWQRAQMPLLLQGDTLVAVPGLFVDQAWRPQSDQAGWRLEWRPARP